MVVIQWIIAYIQVLRWFQRGRLKLDEDLKFSRKDHNECTYRMAKNTIDRPVFTALNRKVEGKCIGSHGKFEKWRTICWIMIINV